VFVLIRYQSTRKEVKGAEKFTPGRVQTTGKAAGLMVVYRYEGKTPKDHLFYTVKVVDGKKVKDVHLPRYDLAVDPETGKVPDWTATVPQYVDPAVPAPAAE
jgi:hypothetical protein